MARGSASRLRPFDHRPRRETASALLVVLVLMAILLSLIASNTAELYQLGQELKLIEKRQLQKFEQAPKSPPFQPTKPPNDLD